MRNFRKKILTVLTIMVSMFTGTIAFAYQGIDEFSIHDPIHNTIAPCFLAALRATVDGFPAAGQPVYREHVNQIRELRIYGQNINSLDGIEHFRDLQRLFAQNNNISGRVNLNFNKELRNVVLQGNNITVLDMEGLYYLTHLNAAGNYISSLYLADARELRGLSVSNNRLVYLNVNGLSNLRVLWAENNQLRNLNLAGLSITRLLLADNYFETINITGLPLVALDLAGNYITDPATYIIGFTELEPALSTDWEYTVGSNNAWVRNRLASGVRLY